DRKSTRLNSSHVKISYAVFCLKKKISANQSRDKSILEAGLVWCGRRRLGRTEIADVIVFVDINVIRRRYVDGLVLVRRYVCLWLRLFLDGVFVLLGGHLLSPV